MKPIGIIALLLPGLLVVALAGCAETDPIRTRVVDGDKPTVSPLLAGSTPIPLSPSPTPPAQDEAEQITISHTPVAEGAASFKIRVDVNRDAHPISPLIYGLSSVTAEHVEGLRPALASWGGNPSTRYNWQLGNAWNSGSDWAYRNGNYGFTGDSASDDFVNRALSAGMEVRLALPTLGWVAKDDDNDTCSFPQSDGECGNANGANCQNPGLIADPALANVPSDPESVKAWLTHLFDEQGFDIRFLAMDNEPELWGYTHYDVHPECTTYDEILEKFLTYATVVREVAPEAEITGPVTCCWNFYWNSAAGEDDLAQHGNQPFLLWFLDQVRAFDETEGERTLDVLDIHYYPEWVYNDEADEATAAHRLRSTRSLWDKNYVDESWIDEPVNLIPTMKTLIERHYPGTKLGISEWNWGADETMNGALAIADVLGILGREDVYMAAYWREPPAGSPGFNAFKLYTNYDDQGGRFGDTSVWAESNDVDQVSAYAALDSLTGDLHLMLINKLPEEEIEVQLDLGSFMPRSATKVFQYTPSDLDHIAISETSLSEGPSNLVLPAYSITLLVTAPGG